MPAAANRLRPHAPLESGALRMARVRDRLRLSLRLLWLAAEILLAAATFSMAWIRAVGHPSRAARASCLQRACRRNLRVFGARCQVDGPLPQRGLVVCNHLGYLDILVLGATAPCVFVSKSDVRRWPVFGWFAVMAGTVFVRRDRRMGVTGAAAGIQRALDEGALVVLFPEGTSSGGDCVLPFKSSLLAPASDRRCPVVPAAIDYRLPAADVSRDVCYWRDMTLVPHLLNLLGRRGLRAHLAFGETRTCTDSDRKTLAIELRADVVRLKQGIVELPTS